MVLSGCLPRETHGKHLGPVWQIQWIEKERGSGEERAEVLISISTDGRVTQWSIRKGFESYGNTCFWALSSPWFM